MRRFLFAFAAIALVACATPATVAPTPAPTKSIDVPTAISPVTASAASCTTTTAAPPDKFRADDPAKIDANSKPKLVEFFAYW